MLICQVTEQIVETRCGLMEFRVYMTLYVLEYVEQRINEFRQMTDDEEIMKRERRESEPSTKRDGSEPE